MTSPIKPPGGPPPPITATPETGVEGLKAPDVGQAREAFRQALDETPEAQAVEGPGALAPTEQLGADLAAGRVDRATAIDTLVAQSLAKPEVALLSPAGRVELETHLREALANDPGLSGLLDDLERSA
ncbi:MAG: hypothetical protein GXP55_14530 [Deltaproteobacteria bacterium]|nr:hypothetical protein [Deltaproteobacteria bacterium]